ncbi:MAG: hypothetical protein KatS3mg002_1584 [Candidatus Woesearchaeota archaeon]|nr:MAG: hypothetical protein KatS3mg002_1584 [Candidatus Woesearchaeota archaeon]
MKNYRREVKRSQGSFINFWEKCLDEGYFIGDWPFVMAAYSIFLEDGGERNERNEKEYRELMARYEAPSSMKNVKIKEGMFGEAE